MEIRFPLLLDGATGTEIQKRGYDGKGSASVSGQTYVRRQPQ